MYRKSSYSESGNCAEVGQDWRKSSLCEQETCVETASAGPGVLVRDSKDVTIPPLRFGGVSWGAFIERVKTEF